jgi:diguanylate cyclase (GGDEF)-like protein
MSAVPKWRENQTRSGTSARASLSRRFTYRYWLAIALCVAIAFTARMSVEQSLDAIDTNAARQTFADGQPARVYRINELAQRLSNVQVGTDVAETDKWSNELNSEAELLVQIQDGLRTGNGQLSLPQEPLDDRLIEVYERQLTNQRVKAVADAGTAIAALRANNQENINQRNAQRLLIEQNGPEAIAGLTRAVDIYNELARSFVSDQRDTNTQLVLLCVAVGVIVVFLLFRPMARQIHQETSQLEEAEQMHRQSNERQTFRNERSQALEVTSTEDEVLAATARALSTIVPDRPAELFLADSSRAHLRIAQTNPLTGAAGCPVESPLSCAAIRRGQTQVYESSRMLNVCPKLPEHDGGPRSAVCVPVMFLGNALGVLHVTGPDGVPPEGTATERLSVLASETANRLGTLRATQVTELQASTDGLTGLLNRRMLEVQARSLLMDARPFSVAMADLDHFKALNDTHGHEAGDRALRLFASVLKANLRPDDIASRYGGEEFVLLLPGTGLDEALAALERLQTALRHEVTRTGAAPFTASWGLTDATAGSTCDEIVAVADAALYAAKRAGRNCIMVDGEAAALAGMGADRGNEAPDAPMPADSPRPPQRPRRDPLVELAVDGQTQTDAG